MSSTQLSHEPITMTVQPPRRSAGFGAKLIDTLVVIIGLLSVLVVATVPLSPREQTIFAICAALIFLVANRFTGRTVTLFLVSLSLTVSLRYLYWRLTETLDFPTPIELVLGSGLVAAEIYAVITLMLGYMQSVWPMERKPIPLPTDPSSWPTVDVLIPTYNEPMSVVRATVLAAIAMDWPRDKMKIWLLDDGCREEFRQFADACGVGYVTRGDNLHAKAGNLNNAMRHTDGEFIAVFDCDHIPTRAFLQLSMGWMVDQPNLAMVQTPHHFYSPDPFQRNLAAGTRVPSEGNMFYGLIQDGNDYWNATFFCGSCAVLRRSALNEIGGFAVETVTEDAHTMLKMHRKGWDSAYLKLPLAAGLATESLAQHIGQRVRWARGMLQIFRIDNPMFGPGLSLGQRLCYLQAMMHFLFALPRVVFLTAPLSYLLLGQNIIAASPLAISAYALPHLLHAIGTNSRLQRNWRHSFWSEIYETVLALSMVRVTISTLISPRKGRFNVTAKGGLMESGFFDLSAVWPNMVLAFLVIAGLIRGVVSMVFVANDALVFQALLLNTIWSALSLIVVLAALSVGREARQIRSRARISANIPVALHMADGRVIAATTRDLSQGGANLSADRPEGVIDGSDITIQFELGEQPLMVPAQVLRWEQQTMQVRWQPKSIEDEARVVQAVFGRADAWSDWAAFPVDRPMASMWRVMVSIRGLFRPRDDRPRNMPGQGGAAARQAASGIVAVMLMLAASVSATAQTSLQTPATTTVRPLTSPNAAPVFGSARPIVLQPTAAPAVPTAAPRPAAAPVGAAAPVLPVAAPAVPLPSAIAPGAAVPLGVPVPGFYVDPAARPNTRRVVYSLRQLGATGPLALRGTSELQGVEFGIRSDEVVTSASLQVSGANSPGLIPEFSNVTVTLNEQYIGTIPTNRERSEFSMDMPVSPVFFQDQNRLNFRFAGRYTQECNDPLHSLLWSTVSDTSTLTLTLERLPPQRDLARLPQPFFDSRERAPLSLPFVIAPTAGSDTLRAAGIAASWFGVQAGFRGASFPVVSEPPSEGNAVLVVVATDGRVPGFLSPIAGPTVGVIANPNDPNSSLLLVAGRSGEEAVAAATALAVGNRALGSDVALVQPAVIAPRVAYDAPNWMPSNRPVKLGELVAAEDLQVYGYTGLVHVPFRTSPDFYTWRDRSFPVGLRYRAPPGPIIDIGPSRLDVGINGIYLNSFSLHSGDTKDSWMSRLMDFGSTRPDARVEIPSYDLYGANDLQFYFDARPLRRGDCGAIPGDLRMSIDPDSTIDLSKGYRFTQMPNLQYFVNSGFPFTRMADLSETAVVLPDRPTAIELSAYLNTMGRFGQVTGYPAIRVAVVRPDGVAAAADRDLLMIGVTQRLQGAADALRNSPVTLSASRIGLSLPSPMDSVRRVFNDRTDQERARAANMLQTGMSDGTTVLTGGQSPYASGRSVVAMLAASPTALETAMAMLHDSVQAPLIQGDLSVLTGGKVTSYHAGGIYTVGTLPLWLYPSYMLRDQPYTLVVMLLIGCLFLGLALFWAMGRKAETRLPTRNARPISPPNVNR